MADDILDIRLLPAWSPSSVKAELRAALGRAQLLQASVAYLDSQRSPLWSIADETIRGSKRFSVRRPAFAD